MKVVCIDSEMSPYVELSIGGIYDVDRISTFEYTYRLVNDKNEIGWYRKDRFISLNEYRRNKLNKLSLL